MERTLDIEGLPEDRIRYLKSLIDLWKKPAGGGAPDSNGDDVHPADFAVRRSDVKGGRVTRAMAYE